MKIGLNLLHAHPEIGGVWNFIEGILQAIPQYDRNNQYYVFSNQISHRLVPKLKNFFIIKVDIDPKQLFHRIIYENSVLAFMSLKYKLDCIHWFANVKSPFVTTPAVVTIHDLLPVQNPEYFSLSKKLYYRLMLKHTSASAKVILPISDYTAEELKSAYRPKTKNIYRLPAIIDHDFRKVECTTISQFKAKYGLPDDFFLYVAHTYKHKNHINLIRAYHKMVSEGKKPWPLVLRGDARDGEPELQDKINQFNLSKHIIRIPRLQKKHMPSLYSGASALIYPSTFEGGGIPVLEAMACGCPIGASRLPAIKEAANDAAIYYDSKNIDQISDVMVQLQHDKNSRSMLIAKGKTRAKLYRPDTIIKKLITAYKVACQ